MQTRNHFMKLGSQVRHYCRLSKNLPRILLVSHSLQMIDIRKYKE